MTSAPAPGPALSAAALTKSYGTSVALAGVDPRVLLAAARRAS